MITYGTIYKKPKKAGNDINKEKEKDDTSFLGIKVRSIPFIIFLSSIIGGYCAFYYLNIKPDFLRVILKYNLLTIAFAIISYLLYERIIGGIFYLLSKITYLWKFLK
jgi:hypothetical protein